MLRQTLLGLVCLSVLHGAPPPSVRPYQARVQWQEGKEAMPWSTALPALDGKESYRLTLRPLWAVEGGIVAMEIVLARPDYPDENLLGQRETDAAQPFVITVEELAAGIERSKFGAKRVFQLPAPDRATLRVEVLASDLRRGQGGCANCLAIRSLTLDLAVGTGRR